MPGVYEQSAGPMRDISRFVEPLDGMRGSASRSMDRITYPGVGGGSGMAGSSAPPVSLVSSIC